jgi:serine/threonine-protein kinase
VADDPTPSPTTIDEPTRAGPPTPAAVPPPVPEPPPPVRLGRYEVNGELGQGGMGRVLCGRDPDLHRDVAVKVMRGDQHADADLRRRFLAEAQIAAQLQHPGVAPVYELGTAADGSPYFAMKVVRGSTLAELLAARSGPADELVYFVSLFERVCQAVAYAHSRGVVHRDLKPGNVMVGEFGEVLVLDWGLAKVLEAGPCGTVRTVRTLSGDVSADLRILGTPGYLAPEQARGDTDGVDARADVFGLGAILCEMLTGQPPFAGPRHVALGQAMQGQLDGACARLDACGADADLVRLARACLALAPADRPADATEVAAQVAAYREESAARARRAEAERVAAEAHAAAARLRQRRAAVLAVVALAALAAVVGLTWRMLAGRLEREERRAQEADDRAGRLERALALATEEGRWRDEEASRLRGRLAEADKQAALRDFELAVAQDLERPGARDALRLVERLDGRFERDDKRPTRPVVKVELAGAALDDAGLRRLATLTELRQLNLAGTNVTDAGLKGLAALKELRLGGTAVTDAGLKELAALRALATLGLEGTGVTDAGLKELAALRELRSLRLAQTAVTDAGVAALKKALPACEVSR